MPRELPLPGHIAFDGEPCQPIRPYPVAAQAIAYGTRLRRRAQALPGLDATPETRIDPYTHHCVYRTRGVGWLS